MEIAEPVSGSIYGSFLGASIVIAVPIVIILIVLHFLSVVPALVIFWGAIGALILVIVMRRMFSLTVYSDRMVLAMAFQSFETFWTEIESVRFDRFSGQVILLRPRNYGKSTSSTFRFIVCDPWSRDRPVSKAVLARIESLGNLQ